MGGANAARRRWSDEAKREWEAFAAKQHARGLCEFSGLRAARCQQTICDCLASPEWAAEVERNARGGA